MNKYREEKASIDEHYKINADRIEEEETAVYQNIERQRKLITVMLPLYILGLAIAWGIFTLALFDDDAPRGLMFWMFFLTFSFGATIAFFVAKVKGDRKNKDALNESEKKKDILKREYIEQYSQLQKDVSSAVESTNDFQKKLLGLSILREIDPENKYYLDQHNKYNNIKTLYDALVPKIISENYGEVNTLYLQVCYGVKTSIVDESISDYSSLIYANALDEKSVFIDLCFGVTVYTECAQPIALLI